MLALAEGASSHPLAAALLQHVDAAQPASAAQLETRNRAQWADDADYEFTYRTIEGQGLEVFDGERTLSVGNHRMAVSRGRRAPSFLRSRLSRPVWARRK